METSNIKLIDKLNAVDREYYVLKLVDKRSYKIMNIYGRVLGTIIPYTIGEIGAYFDIEGSITDLSLEELRVITQMVEIIDKQEHSHELYL